MLLPITVSFSPLNTNGIFSNPENIESLDSITYDLNEFPNIDAFTQVLDNHAQKLADESGERISHTVTMVKDKYIYMTGGVRWIEVGVFMLDLLKTAPPAGCDIAAGDIYYKANSNLLERHPQRAAGFSDGDIHSVDGAYWFGVSVGHMKVDYHLTAMSKHISETGACWFDLGQKILNALPAQDFGTVISILDNSVVTGVIAQNEDATLTYSHPAISTLLKAFSITLHHDRLHNLPMDFDGNLSKEEKLNLASESLKALGILPA